MPVLVSSGCFFEVSGGLSDHEPVTVAGDNQIIGALNDMEIEDNQDDGMMECEGMDEDLLGIDLKDMEEREALQVVSKATSGHVTSGTDIKVLKSSRQGTKVNVPLGLQKKKFEILRRGSPRKPSSSSQGAHTARDSTRSRKHSQSSKKQRGSVSKVATAVVVPRDGPPGFPDLFPELSKEDHKMAMMYISHSDATKRLARIQRVRQGIADNQAESSLRLTKITKELDKGKGHVYSYKEQYSRDDSLNYGGLVIRRKIDDGSDGETKSSASKISVHSSPVVHSGFQLGPSSEGRVLRKPGNNGSQRKRPSSWKRKSLGQRSVEAGLASVEVQDHVTDRIGSSKRKSSFAVNGSENKNPKITSSVASSAFLSS
ncbi:hypothetical protein Bca52824_082005 [Brassica carinata]|uniref:Uncharacterized protein n=1 Tax=Brassica carinata TaxID=52824 RepID=A0A8X7PG72_BRACI|nr:hypothetical protein Bca52824_082005 [Brassica carinata]